MKWPVIILYGPSFTICTPKPQLCWYRKQALKSSNLYHFAVKTPLFQKDVLRENLHTCKWFRNGVLIIIRAGISALIFIWNWFGLHTQTVVDKAFNLGGTFNLKAPPRWKERSNKRCTDFSWQPPFSLNTNATCVLYKKRWCSFTTGPLSSNMCATMPFAHIPCTQALGLHTTNF